MMLIHIKYIWMFTASSLYLILILMCNLNTHAHVHTGSQLHWPLHRTQGAGHTQQPDDMLTRPPDSRTWSRFSNTDITGRPGRATTDLLHACRDLGCVSSHLPYLSRMSPECEEVPGSVQICPAHINVMAARSSGIKEQQWESLFTKRNTCRRDDMGRV